VTDLDKLVARLEKVNEQLDKKQTRPLREEQTSLMVKIQQTRQKQREGAGPSVAGPAPDGLSAGAGVNGEQ
jgi:hypothetical protein